MSYWWSVAREIRGGGETLVGVAENNSLTYVEEPNDALAFHDRHSAERFAEYAEAHMSRLEGQVGALKAVKR